jgi:hypothetical protein
VVALNPALAAAILVSAWLQLEERHLDFGVL